MLLERSWSGRRPWLVQGAYRSLGGGNPACWADRRPPAYPITCFAVARGQEMVPVVGERDRDLPVARLG
jgi:hypothetical protein